MANAGALDSLLVVACLVPMPCGAGEHTNRAGSVCAIELRSSSGLTAALPAVASCRPHETALQSSTWQRCSALWRLDEEVLTSIGWRCGISCIDHHRRVGLSLEIAVDTLAITSILANGDRHLEECVAFACAGGFVAPPCGLYLASAGIAAHQSLCWRLSVSPPLAVWVEGGLPASLRVLDAAWPLRRDRTMDDRLPGAHVAGTDGRVDEGSFDWPRARSRLSGVLVWAGAGFAGISALSFVLFELLEVALHGTGIGGLGGASACVAIGFAGCLGVRAVAFSLGENQRGAAKALLCFTTLGYAVLVNVFAATYNVTDDAQEGFDWVLLVAGSVAAAGAGVLGALAIGILVGLGSPARTFLRSPPVLSRPSPQS